MQDICVIVPTIRNPECVTDYVANAEDHGFDTDRLFFVLVTEDFCDTEEMEAMLDRLGVDGAVFDGQRRSDWFEEQGLAEYEDVVPAASHAETSFGLLWMLAHDRFEYGIFIDDDTEPHPDYSFFQKHLDNLTADGERFEEVASDKHWVNVLYQHFDRHELYPRGYPYSCMDESVETGERTVSHPVASQGLWTNIPDLDAVRILMDGNLEGQAETLTHADDFDHQFVAARHNYLTVCSMNLGFRREVIPAFYQFPMDDNEWEVGRFDDIWSGLTLKKACDMLGNDIINGFPLCIHNKKERSTFSDLHNEVAGLELNEHFWEALDEAPDEAEDYFDAYDRMIDAVKAYDFSGYINEEFMDLVVQRMEEWIACCRELS